MERKSIAQIESNWVRAKRKQVCMHPTAPANCSRQFVKAHSVQKSKLNMIADSGHVLKFKSDPMTGQISIDKIGIRKASAFSGFCAYHDDKLFSPIEKKSLDLNKENALLLAYRAMSIHMYYKRLRMSTDLLATVSRELIPTQIKQRDASTRLGLDRLMKSAEQIYARMGKAIIQQDFKRVNYFAIIFGNKPDILCSEVSMINFGFQGQLVRERPVPYDFLTLSMLPYPSKRGIDIFSWFGKCPTNEAFLRSLLGLCHTEIPDAIVRFTFRGLQNFFISPK